MNESATTPLLVSQTASEKRATGNLEMEHGVRTTEGILKEYQHICPCSIVAHVIEQILDTTQQRAN